MYKTANRHDDMMRLVERFHSEHVDEAHLRLAEELEASGETRAAEEQYVRVGAWQAAINMYTNAGAWEDAYRVARANEGANAGGAASRRVLFAWARSLRGDAAVKLLQRYHLLDEAIESGAKDG